MFKGFGALGACGARLGLCREMKSIVKLKRRTRPIVQQIALSCQKVLYSRAKPVMRSYSPIVSHKPSKTYKYIWLP